MNGRQALVASMVLCGTSPVTAQAQTVTRAVEVYAGWQQPLAQLRRDSVLSVHRRGAMSIGLGGYIHAAQPVLWRATGEVTFTDLEVEQRRSTFFVPAGTTARHERPEYTLSVDGAKRVAAGRLAGRAADLRWYTGAALRRIGTTAFLTSQGSACITEDLPCSTGADYKVSIGPVWRAGILATIQGAGVRTRVDLGYQLSKPWHVFQHDLRLGIRFGPG
jgi:hypothetical protein